MSPRRGIPRPRCSAAPCRQDRWPLSTPRSAAQEAHGRPADRRDGPGLQSLSTTLGGLSRATITTPIRYYGQSTLPACGDFIPWTTCTNIWALVEYARMNSIVPPWTRKG